MKREINGEEYEVIIEKSKTSDELRTREDEKMFFAYNLAKQICAFAENNGEVKDIIQKIGCVFEWHRMKQKPEIPVNPITSGGFSLKKIVSKGAT